LDLKKVCRKAYNYGCVGIRDKLAYIKCEACEYRFKYGRLKDTNILIKNIRILPELSNAEAKIALMLGIVFDGENPSFTRISKKTKMNYNTVKRAIIGLKGKGII